LENETWNETPIPFGLAVADTKPFTLPLGSPELKNCVLGRAALKISPGGFSSVVVALPRIPVTGLIVVWALAMARIAKVRTVVCILSSGVKSRCNKELEGVE
jgi:hypothetical protein